MLLVDNSYASEEARERAYDERNDEVFRATGVKMENPYRASQEELDRSTEERRFSGTFGFKRWRDRLEAEWMQKVSEAANRIPDSNVVNRLTRSIDGDAQRIARGAEERLGVLAQSRPGVGSFAVQAAGAIVGSMQDPLQVGTLVLGGGVGAGRTVAARILSAAAREAMVNGAAEAALQPMVQAWREKAGLDSGLDVAMRNVALAAALGGGLGGALQGGLEVAAKLTGRSLGIAGEVAADAPQVKPEIRAAMRGDIGAAQAALPEIRGALPPQARGALDHAGMLEHMDAARPKAATPERHDELASEAHRAVEEAALRPFRPDEEQIARVVEAVLGPEAPPLPAGRSLVEFLADRGIIDDAGELASIGASDLSRNRARKGKPDRRVTLDYAREAAEEAGYIGRAGEVQVTTVPDLLNAIDAELRGSPVYAREDTDAEAGRAINAGVAAERARAADIVAEIQSYAGPAVDDAIIARAATIALRDGIDAFDALENVLVKMDDAGRAGRDGAIAPGWSDAELEAASAGRGDRPEPDGIDEPGEVDEIYAITPDEFEEFGEIGIPGDGDELVPLSAYMADIARTDDAAFMLENCRL
jgi:hypothetical protein